AVRTYLNRFAVAPGRRVVVFTAGDDGWRTARDAKAAGLEVAAVVDARPNVPRAHADALGPDVRVVAGGSVIAAFGAHGLAAVQGRDAAGRAFQIHCDLLAMSGGWDPAVHLTCHLGGRPRWNDALAAFVPGELPGGLAVAGAAAGSMTLGRCLAEGAAA